MPTVVDSLIVTLGLDPSNFRKGTEQAGKSLEATRDKVTKASDDMGRSLASLGRMAATLFLGFEGVSGALKFLGTVNNTTDRIGLLSKNLGTSASALAAWGNAVKANGGSVEDAANAFALLSKTASDYNQKGVVSETLAYIANLGLQLDQRDIPGTLSKIGEKLRQIQTLNGRQTAYNYGAGMGLNEGVLNLLLSGDFDAQIAKQEKLTRDMQAQTEAARAASNAWSNLGTSIEAFGRAVNTSASPAINSLVTGLTKLANAATRHEPQIWGFLTGWTHYGSDRTSDALNAALGRQGGASAATGASPVGGWRQTFAAAIRGAEGQYGLPAGLLGSLIQRESGYDPHAVGKVGEQGLAQLRPQFFPGAGQNPYRDIDTAARYLSSLYAKYHDWGLALVAYNDGPSNFDRNPEGALGKSGGYARDILSHMKDYGLPAPYSAPAATTAPASGKAAEVNIGTINLYTQATDANGISLTLRDTIARNLQVMQANTGMTP